MWTTAWTKTGTNDKKKDESKTEQKQKVTSFLFLCEKQMNLQINQLIDLKWNQYFSQPPKQSNESEAILQSSQKMDVGVYISEINKKK